jgi:hypothetical protein
MASSTWRARSSWSGTSMAASKSGLTETQPVARCKTRPSRKPGWKCAGRSPFFWALAIASIWARAQATPTSAHLVGNDAPADDAHPGMPGG